MYRLLLCLRYLRTKYIALACIVSVMLGVATMIVVNSVMAGFSYEMRDRLHDFLADVIIESRSTSGLPDSKGQMALIQEVAGDQIEAMTATVEIPGMITFTDRYSGESYTVPVHIHGIDPVGKSRIGPLRSYLDSYNAVVENDVVIREPLRDPAEELSWELTPEARRYRRYIKEEDALYLRQSTWAPESTEDSVAAEVTPSDLNDGLTETPADAAALNGAVVDAGGVGESSEETPQFSESAAPDFAAVDDPDADGDLFSPEALSAISEQAPGENWFPQEDQGPVDLEEQIRPLQARVYLGEGIISFQAEAEDGSMQKVRLIEAGDDIILSTVTAGRPPEVRKFNATVVDLFRSGMSEYDNSIVLMNLDQLQQHRGMIADGQDAVSHIHLKLKDYDRADEVVRNLQAAFPPGAVIVRTWEQKQGLLLAAVEVETAILNVLLFLIIAVAGFGILAIFFMIVVEKTRDIGILKSLGASSNGVMSIFLSYGLGLGIVGSAAGVGIGLLFVHYINEIEDLLSWITGRRVFDESIYYFSEIPTLVSPGMVFWVAVGAITIAVLASVFPARRAAGLHPVRALRHE